MCVDQHGIESNRDLKVLLTSQYHLLSPKNHYYYSIVDKNRAFLVINSDLSSVKTYYYVHYVRLYHKNTNSDLVVVHSSTHLETKKSDTSFDCYKIFLFSRISDFYIKLIFQANLYFSGNEWKIDFFGGKV